MKPPAGNSVQTAMDGVFEVLFPTIVQLFAWCALVVGTRAASTAWPPENNYTGLFRARWTVAGAGLLCGCLWGFDAMNSLMVFTLISHGTKLYPLLDISRCLEAIPSVVILYVVLRRERLREVFGIRCGIKTWLWTLSSFVILLGVSIGGWSLDSMRGISEQSVRPILRQAGPYRALWSIFMVGLVTPATEEVLYRGVVLDSLRRAVSSKLGSVMCATLFAAAHAGSLFATLSYLCSGLILNSLRDRYDSLLPAFLVHVAINALLMVGANVAGPPY